MRSGSKDKDIFTLPGDGVVVKPMCGMAVANINIGLTLSNNSSSFLPFLSSWAIHWEVLWAEHPRQAHLLHWNPGSDNQH